MSATGKGSGMVRTSTSPGRACAIAAWTIRLSPCPHSTGRAGPAAREPGTIRCSVEVDQPLAARGLVDGRGPEPRELRAHSSATT